MLTSASKSDSLTKRQRPIWAALLVLKLYSGPPLTPSDLFPPTYGFSLLGLLFTCALLMAVTENGGWFPS